MASSSAIGATIEGEKLDVQTRKFEAYPPKRDSATNVKQFAFKLGIRSSAEISEAYPNPPAVCHYTNSMFAVADRVEGTVISGWAYRALGKPNVETCSGRHSGSVLSIKGGALATVDISPREHLESPGFLERDPPRTMVRRVANVAAVAPTGAVDNNEGNG